MLRFLETGGVAENTILNRLHIILGQTGLLTKIRHDNLGKYEYQSHR
jgi:hypothetical protein